MIQDRLIICVASAWDQAPTSKHHLMRIFARCNDVVWVNYHASRRPQLNRKDMHAAWRTLSRVWSGVQRIGPRMVQVTPMLVPGATGDAARWLNRRMVVAQIRRAVGAVRRGADQPVQVWSFAPDADFIAEAFSPECVVYYCVDEFSGFEGCDAESTALAERRMIAAADVVIATSSQLCESKSRLTDQVHLVRHGVDYDHFRRAVDGWLETPPPIRSLAGPMIGFVGLVDHWVDAELLAATARSLPDVHVVVVGEVRIDASELDGLANVHFVGRQPYDVLPNYLARFNAGLIPFVRSELTENVNPIKLREYLAAGLPVVSTDLPEVRRFGAHVLIADDHASFAAACRRAIASDTPPARMIRSAAVADQGWESVAEQVSAVAANASHGRSPRIDLSTATR